MIHHIHSWSFRLSLLIVFISFLIIGVFSSINLSQSENLCNSNYIFLNLKYLNGNFEIINKSLESGCISKSPYNENIEYSYKLITHNEIYGSGSFNAGVLFIDNIIDDQMVGGTVDAPEQEISLAIPYYTSADNMQVFKQGNLIFETKLYDVNATSCRIL